VVLGVAALVLWQYVALQQRQQVQQQSEASLERAQAAVVAYAQLHARLPCPASDTQGKEDCGSPRATRKEYVPYKTIGMPLPAAGKMSYHLQPGGPPLTAPPPFHALMPFKDNSDPLNPNNVVATPIALHTLAPSTYDRMLDFCSALGSSSQDVAFTVGEEPGPASARAVLGAATARIVSRAQLRGQLPCASLMAAGGRAHMNAWLAAATMLRSLQDYQTQFNVGYGLYTWDWVQGFWFLLNSTYGSLKHMVKYPNAMSSIHANIFDDVAQAISAAKGMVTTTLSLANSMAYTLAMTSNLARFSNNLVEAQENRKAINHLLARAVATELEIGRNALRNSASVFFLAEQAQQALGTVPPGPDIAGIYDGGGPLGRGALLYARKLGGGNHVVDVPPADCSDPKSEACKTRMDAIKTALQKREEEVNQELKEKREALQALREEEKAILDPEEKKKAAQKVKEMENVIQELEKKLGDIQELDKKLGDTQEPKKKL
jgi:hypothetical protein